MIKVSDVSYQIGDKVIFENLNINIKSGEVVAVVGKSGSGKTTFINMLSGFLQPLSGEININGCINPYYKSKAGKKMLFEDISIIFQNYVLIDEKTVRQNFDLISKHLKTHLEYEEVLSMTGLSDEVLEIKVSSLSGGEQQRVAIARALLLNKPILLADEPTGNLDVSNRDRIFKIFRTINERFGTTIILVTHDMQLAHKCDWRVQL